MTTPAGEDFTPPYRYPFLIGQYLATNAIPDAYSVVDGPDCLFFKAEYIHGKHDRRSTLLNVFGSHRIALTNINAGNVATSRGEAVAAKIRRIDSLPGANLVFVTSLPMVTIIGTQYDNLIRDNQPVTGARLVEVPGRSLQGDWLDGYADTLDALAAGIELDGAAPDPRKVAVIGYLCDRGEEDHAGNVRELERLFAGIGLELVCVWLGNQDYHRLARVKEAGLLLSLPLGRRAAKTLAERTGAKVVETELPLGPGRTQRLLRRAAKAADRAQDAERFIAAELARVAPRLEWVVPHVFLGRRAAFSGPPDHFGGFLQLAQEVGLEVVHLSAPCAPKWHAEDLAREFDGAPTPLFEPKQRALTAELMRLFEAEVDVVVCNSELRRLGLDDMGIAVVEYGFPSRQFHALWDSPSLGFEGWACLLDRMANAMLDQGARRLAPLVEPQGALR